MSRNTSNGERPSERVSSGSSSSNGTGGTSACSFSNSAIQRGGNRSTRVAITWPSLTNVGPSSSSAMRMRCAGSSVTASATGLQCRIWPARSSTPAMPMRWTKSPRPWRMKTDGDLVQPRQLAHDAEGLPQHRRWLGVFFCLSAADFSSASAMPASTPLAICAKRTLNWPASSMPVKVNSFIRCAVRRPVSVPAWVARSTSARSSGRTRSLAELGDLAHGGDEVLLDLLQPGKRLLHLVVADAAAGGHHLAQRLLARLHRLGERLVHAAERLPHRLAHASRRSPAPRPPCPRSRRAPLRGCLRGRSGGSSALRA